MAILPTGRSVILAVAVLTATTGCIRVNVGPDEDPPSRRGAADPGRTGRAASRDKDGNTLRIMLPSVPPTATGATGGTGGNGGGLAEALGQLAKVASTITMGAEHGAVFHAYDMLAFPGQATSLTARLQRADNLQGLGGARIGYYQGATKLGEALTDANGYAALPFTPLGDGDYALTVKILAVPQRRFAPMLDVSPAHLLVAARGPKTEIVVVDLDHTLVASGFHHVLLGTAKPMAGSQAVLQRLARRYTLVYLTHRPNLLGRRSKGWLRQYGYPPAPVLLSTISQAVGGSASFKTGKLAELRKAYPNVRIGIGDKVSDTRSYAENNIPAYLIPHYKDKPSDLRKLAAEIRSLPSTVQVVHDWRQVQAGIFDAQRYPPAPFAHWLEARARHLEADDDDDDDS